MASVQSDRAARNNRKDAALVSFSLLMSVSVIQANTQAELPVEAPKVRI